MPGLFYGERNESATFRSRELSVNHLPWAEKGSNHEHHVPLEAGGREHSDPHRRWRQGCGSSERGAPEVMPTVLKPSRDSGFQSQNNSDLQSPDPSLRSPNFPSW
ncbi:hypothetical protein Y1Q_0006600 [Alligator mississippiensis]|uniref:Uncharacterized protein n=1 Tax=Alligator mississippiensis TaxID=8496 RepID=A0A151NT70_ALLMI|nr:hypothetical protein Y1Q_0006600 [Alligator mississippiensis]